MGVTLCEPGRQSNRRAEEAKDLVVVHGALGKQERRGI
jgi:hypothetical protein